jgi:choline transport protein
MDAVELKQPYGSTMQDGDYSPGDPSGHTSMAYEATLGNTAHDVRDMNRLGKKQEFKRNFDFISTLGFISIYMATWEFVLVSLSAGFTNGGYGGLFWTFIGTVICYSTIVASLAEMESM